MAETYPQSYTVTENDSAGLNAIVQRYGFKNYKEAGISSVPSGNFDLIRPGEVINFNPPKAPAPTVMTSNQANDNINNIQSTIDTYTNTELPKTTAEKAVGDINSLADTAYQTYKDRLTSINRRDLGPEEQSELDNVQSTFDRTYALQEKANQEFEAGTRIAGIRAGRNRYATEIDQGNIKAAIDQGIGKLADLDSKAKSKMFELKQAMLDKDFELATKEYDTYSELIKDKKKSIFDLAELARQDARLAIDEYNATRTADIKEYEYAVSQGYEGSMMDYAKAARDAKRVASGGGNTLTADLAKQLGLPPSLVGMNEKELISSFKLSSPPNWFRQLFKGSNIQIPELLQGEWDNLRKNPNIQVYANTINKTSSNSSNSSSFNTSSLPPPIQD